MHIIAQSKWSLSKSNTYIDINKENDEEDSKFEVGDHVRISNNKNIFAKGYTPN